MQKLSFHLSYLLKSASRKYKIQFLDVAKYYPKDTRYFIDPIHFTQKGSELLAEIISNLLTPHLEKLINKHP